jgi:hypothetical protein
MLLVSSLGQLWALKAFSELLVFMYNVTINSFNKVLAYWNLENLSFSTFLHKYSSIS